MDPKKALKEGKFGTMLPRKKSVTKDMQVVRPDGSTYMANEQQYMDSLAMKNRTLQRYKQSEKPKTAGGEKDTIPHSNKGIDYVIKKNIKKRN